MPEFLPLFALLLPYLLIVMGIGLIASGISSAITNNRSRSWPTTTGKVISSKITRSIDIDTGTDYFPRVQYEYQVDNKTYRSKNVSFVGSFGSGKKAAEDRVKQYPVGQEVTVYYHPNKPKKATLEPGASNDAAVFAIAVTGVLIIICWLAWAPPIREVLALLPEI